jgi:aryl-alcohol dehydrogenase-like predicted oxidoreductase
MSGLALGTVQFGLDYGIKNKRGCVPEAEVRSILAAAKAGGVDTLDTAVAYGKSESVLGRTIEGSEGFSIISKMPAAARAGIREELKGSLARLACGSIYGYLLHSFTSYRENPGLLWELAECREEGLVQKIGVSLYRPEEAEALVADDVPLDLVQVPYSILDRRFERVFDLLKTRGVEIHVRSVFLQGLFFMDAKELAPRFESVRKSIGQLQRLARDSGLGIAGLCLGFASLAQAVDRVVIGVDGLADLAANLEAWGTRNDAAAVLAGFEDIRSEDEGIILPFNWNKL